MAPYAPDTVVVQTHLGAEIRPAAPFVVQTTEPGCCPTLPADVPEQQDDERDRLALLLLSMYPGTYEDGDRSERIDADAILASRRPAEADQQRRQDVGQRVLNVMLTSGHPPNSGALALAIADALLSAPAEPAGRDDAQ